MIAICVVFMMPQGPKDRENTWTRGLHEPEYYAG